MSKFCGCPMCRPESPDPRLTPEFFMRGEARMVLKMPTLAGRRKYLEGVAEKRGKDSADKLRRVIEEIWAEQRGVTNAAEGAAAVR